ncbi:PPE family protein [Mycobacterium kansasii]|nr:PPE family protein [Mycobacterium kansasii]
MLQAAASWQRLADELTSAAASFESVTEALVGDSWQGWAAAAMASAAAPYASWLNAAAAGPRVRPSRPVQRRRCLRTR